MCVWGRSNSWLFSWDLFNPWRQSCLPCLDILQEAFSWTKHATQICTWRSVLWYRINCDRIGRRPACCVGVGLSCLWHSGHHGGWCWPYFNGRCLQSHCKFRPCEEHLLATGCSEMECPQAPSTTEEPWKSQRRATCVQDHKFKQCHTKDQERGKAPAALNWLTRLTPFPATAPKSPYAVTLGTPTNTPAACRDADICRHPTKARAIPKIPIFVDMYIYIWI